MKNTYLIGIVFAVTAAMLNGSVGIFSRHTFENSLGPSAVAFYKTFFAFLVLSIYVLFNKKALEQVSKLKANLKQIALCSFCGIFTLYYFETSAYKFDLVAIVVFILLGASAITTFVVSSLLLSEKKNVQQYMGLGLAMIGLGIIFLLGNNYEVSLGALLAFVAGTGYGLFLVLTKKFRLDGGIVLVWYLLGFGTLYLFIPFISQGFVIPTVESVPSLLGLALLPTIGGYYCTTMALSYMTASKVQIFELSEPIFATVFAFFFLSEWITGAEWLGCILILLAIYIAEYERKQSTTLSYVEK